MSLKEKLRQGISTCDQLFLDHRLLRTIKRGKAPNTISLDVSGTCNLRCTICSLKDWYPVSETKVVSDKVVERVAAYAGHLKQISLQCNCEPLLNPQVHSIVRTLKQANPSSVVSFVTNGTMLTRKRSEQLVKCGIDEIVVSLDGATEESYEDVRVGSHFHKVITNIRTFNEVRTASTGSKTRLGAIAVATTTNLAELGTIMKLAISLGAEHFQVNGLEPYTKEQQSIIAYGYKPDTRAKAAFAELRILAKKHGIALTLPPLRLRSRRYCVRSMIAIDPDGNVFPCAQLSYKRPFLRDGEQMMHPRICFGNLHDMSLESIVASPEFTAHRDAVLKGHLPAYCKGCLVKDLVIC